MYIELCNVTLQIPKQPELKSFELRKYDLYGLLNEYKYQNRYHIRYSFYFSICNKYIQNGRAIIYAKYQQLQQHLNSSEVIFIL